MNLDNYTNEQLLATANKLGNSYLGLISDEELIKWNGSKEAADEIKIQRLKCHLKFYETGIDAFILLNETKAGLDLNKLKTKLELALALSLIHI